ncbi:MAG: HNH endonuclease [Spirochaetaceae bacterium]|nr:HNH endonuclease [Spirochaetaceae bacterium]
MQDLQTFYDWMILSAKKGESTAYHYKSGLSACSKDFLAWKLSEKPIMEMSLSELDVTIQKAFLNSLFIDKNTRGNNMYSNSLKQYRNFLAVHDALLLDNSYTQFLGDITKITKTEREAIINARIGQGVFRDQLIKKYDGRCIVTGVDDKRILLASHIRPWSVSSNEQRLSLENGLLLSPLYDRLFDTGLITFSEEGQIICSKELETKNIDLLKIDRKRKYDLKTSAVFIENLKYHQNVVFLGAA